MPDPQLDPATQFRFQKQAEFMAAVQNLHAQCLTYSMTEKFAGNVAMFLSHHLDGITALIKGATEPPTNPTGGQPS